jgi:hypothetical protein
MQDPYVIMNTGFKNVVENGATTGYQLDIRIPYYRGTYLSLIDSLSLSVDGQSVTPDHLRISLGGKFYTMAQMQEADDVRWGFGDPAILRAIKSGGLTPGIHTVAVGIAIRKSYFPPEDPEHLYDFFGLWKGGTYHAFLEAPTVVTKKMTLVQ